MEDQLFNIAEAVPFQELWLMLLGYILVIVARQAGDTLRYLFEWLNSIIINRRDEVRAKNVDHLNRISELEKNLEEKESLIREITNPEEEAKSDNR